MIDQVQVLVLVYWVDPQAWLILGALICIALIGRALKVVSVELYALVGVYRVVHQA